MRRIIRCLVLSVFILAPWLNRTSSSGVLSPDAVFEKAQEVNTFKDFIIDANMLQKGPNLPERAYLVNMKGKAVGEDTFFLIRFLKPSDIRGIGVLLKRKGHCVTEQLIYLPYARRIISFSKDGDQPGLVQTDFEPEDLGNPHLFWKSRKFVRQESLEGRRAYVYESFPDSSRCSHYKKVTTWVDAEKFVPVQLLKYDQKGLPVKRFHFGRMVQLNKKWLATEMTVTDLLTRHSTMLRITGGRYGIAIPDTEFSREALKDFHETEEGPQMEGN